MVPTRPRTGPLCSDAVRAPVCLGQTQQPLGYCTSGDTASRVASGVRACPQGPSLLGAQTWFLCSGGGGG